jgi:Fe(3+) dicitrate transport protein
MSTGVLRNEDFPVDDEIGDNFNLGIRSTAIEGLDFEVAGFYQNPEKLSVRCVVLRCG